MGGTVWYSRPWGEVADPVLSTAWSTRPCHPTRHSTSDRALICDITRELGRNGEQGNPPRDIDMILGNTETVPGCTVPEFKWLVQGNTIRAKHLGSDLAASLENIVREARTLAGALVIHSSFNAMMILFEYRRPNLNL